MIKDLILKELRTNDNTHRNLSAILDESIKEAESMFGKSLRQLPPKGEAHDFLINMVEVLMKDKKFAVSPKEIMEDFCNSDKSFGEFMETLTVGGYTSTLALGRHDLYDTTRVVINQGIGDQNVANVDQDDLGKVPPEDVFNQDMVGKTPKKKDLKGDEDEAFTPPEKQIVVFKREDAETNQRGQVLTTYQEVGALGDVDTFYSVEVLEGKDKNKIIDICGSKIIS